MSWRFYLKVENWSDSARLFGVFENPPFGGSVKPGLVRPMVFEEYKEGAYFPDDAAMLAARPEDVKDFLRAMADCAYENGILPTALQGQTNRDNQELKAVRGHLEDMRAIVGKQLKIPNLLPKETPNG